MNYNAKSNNFDRGFIAGYSKPLLKILNIVAKVAKSDSSALITGESGTGKELIAKAIHNNSTRHNKPMVVINCGAIPSELLESELFGHEKGSYTGAHRSRAGRFELANKGTIFLDEIGDMSPDLQVKLLRALQERRFERVGGSNTIEVDIRVISATNKNLQASIEKNIFREDLYYRLNVIPIHIPALRERKEDIFTLIDYFQNNLSKKRNSYKVKNFSKNAQQVLSNYTWPGNVRELENLVERLSVLVDNETIQINDLPDYIVNNSANTNSFDSAALIVDSQIGFNKAVEKFQRDLILYALNDSKWVKAKAAKLLQINRTTLVEKIKKMNIEREKEDPVF